MVEIEREARPGEAMAGHRSIRHRLFVLAALVAAGVVVFGITDGTSAVEVSMRPAGAVTGAPTAGGGRSGPALAPAAATAGPSSTTSTVAPAPTAVPTTAPAVTTQPGIPAATPPSTMVAPAPAPAPAPAVAPSPAAVPAATAPTVATLVARVEADGIDPGPNWGWRMGDTAVECGAIPGNGVGTGCTYSVAGVALTVFAGAPTLALVAHELANAETENDAVPSLVAQVAAAEAGTSWSSIDAVASCLVAHFMGFQDHAAGTWECPAPLAAVVAAHIHDLVQAAT